MIKIEKGNFENKERQYNYINMKLKAYIVDEKDSLANLCNAAAILGNLLNDINWSGFYLYKNNELVLAPFWGKPACTHIQVGKGVCGKVAQTREIEIVKDVHLFPGHIACDSESQSEIVLPIIKDGELFGVLDIDSPIKERFDIDDKKGLEKFVEILIEHGKLV